MRVMELLDSNLETKTKLYKEHETPVMVLLGWSEHETPEKAEDIEAAVVEEEWVQRPTR
jgi:hypothetical protein